MPSLGLAACLCTARRAIPTSFQQPDRWILVDKGSASGKEISQRGVTWSQTLKAQSSRRPANLPATLTWRLMATLKRMPEKFKRLSARLKRLSENKGSSRAGTGPSQGAKRIHAFLSYGAATEKDGGQAERSRTGARRRSQADLCASGLDSRFIVNPARGPRESHRRAGAWDCWPTCPFFAPIFRSNFFCS
jgi:hypothetical protein